MGQFQSQTWKAGFSLLEVLGAVVVLTFVYAALSQTAILGLRAEGEAARRVRASAIADYHLAELEALILVHDPPPVGREIIEDEDEDDSEFQITIDVSSFNLFVPEVEFEPGSLQARHSEEEIEGPSLLSKSENSLDDTPPLRKINVRVEWQEGEFTRHVSRSTLLFDKIQADDIIATLPVRLEGSSTLRDENDTTRDPDSEEPR